MKALTMYEPWATLLVLGYKHFETRSWQTAYRGPLAIHAAQNGNYMRKLPAFLEHAGLPAELADTLLWAQGQFIGLVMLVDCYATGPQFVAQQQLSDRETALGDFTIGRFAWDMRHRLILPDPISFLGARMLWPVPCAMAQQLLALAVIRGV